MIFSKHDMSDKDSSNVASTCYQMNQSCCLKGASRRRCFKCLSRKNIICEKEVKLENIMELFSFNISIILKIKVQRYFKHHGNLFLPELSQVSEKSKSTLQKTVYKARLHGK